MRIGLLIHGKQQKRGIHIRVFLLFVQMGEHTSRIFVAVTVE